MAVGIGMVGRQVTMTVGGATLVGVIDKGLARSNTPVDVTDDQSSGWTELLAIAGTKSASLSISGPFKNLELVQTYFQPSQMVECVLTYPDGSTETFDAFLESLETSGGQGDAYTFSATLQTSGAIAFVAGT